MPVIINLNGKRAKKARLWHKIGDTGYFLLRIAFVILAITGIFCIFIFHLQRVGYISLAFSLISLVIALWYGYDLANNPPNFPGSSIDDLIDPTLLNQLRKPVTPQSVWRSALNDKAGRFVSNRLFLDNKSVENLLENDEESMTKVWQAAVELAKDNSSDQLHAGTLVSALILTSQPTLDLIKSIQLKPEDVKEVYGWLDRQLGYMNRPKPYFGGLGRDWASGFTPTLERVGENVSQAIEAWGGYGRFAAHGDTLPGIANNLAQGTAVSLVGPPGVGKTELVFALADRLLSAQVPGLRYYQIVSLNASSILSSSQNLEGMMTYLFGEAIAANNIILYLDEAQLFFGEGVGAFNMGQLLLPVLKNRNLKIIASFTPNDWQHFKSTNESLASSFSPVIINEPPLDAIKKVVEDSALLLELHQNGVLITYEAINEAIRLSGQFMQEDAYPGKAITLIEQSIPYSDQGVMLATTVQQAIEKMRGVRVSHASEPEADMLLHLEDRIHERMINQKKAVSDIAAALRRSRAGVSSTKRPVGTFLFLGPTGVGKTELAKSLAAVYFGDEHQMIRLDMSEYQNPEDVSRLLKGSDENSGNNLLTSIRSQPFSVVLLDEIEKAHVNILNLLLQMLDEGQLTDEHGKPASFRNAIIIATSNAGATDIIARVREQQAMDEKFERELLNQLIATGIFKPELINRFDEVVLFRPLNGDELAQVAQLMLDEVNKTLSNQNVSVELTPEALAEIVREGYDPEFGARPMRRVIQKSVENAVAIKILNQQAQPGSVIMLDVRDLAAAEDNNES